MGPKNVARKRLWIEKEMPGQPLWEVSYKVLLDQWAGPESHGSPPARGVQPALGNPGDGAQVN